MWTLDHLADLESDFSVFHRVPSVDIDRELARTLGIDALPDLDGPRFFRMAVRLPAYDGVLAARIAAEQEEGPGPAATRSAPAEQPTEVPLAQLQAQHPDWIEKVQVD